MARREDTLRWLDLVPDIPRWVETRGMLVMARGHVVEDARDPEALVVSSDVAPLLAIVGVPSLQTLRAALDARSDTPEIIVALECAATTVEMIPGWSASTVILHAWSGVRRTSSSAEVRFIGAESLHDDIPSGLRAELQRALGWSPMAAAFVGGRAVSFCYATSETETLWDVSIDTLAPWRGRGLAAACVDAMIERMLAVGKRPVWGAVEENAASLALARKLGFEPVDRIALVTERPFTFEHD